MTPRPRRAGSRSLAAILARAAPFVLSAVAAAIWLRRRQADRPVLPERAGVAPPGAPPPVAPMAAARTGRFDRQPSGRFDRRPTGRSDRRPTGRFARRPIDIVTVVDDLLGSGG